ncbi:MAG: DnaJ domain-containing protein [Peptoniphilaceae bacterium]|uniref:J domain-containing protein n=1 Tax=Parvimonas sp. TaxID=1944660 RepID=UPI0025EADA2A|nr:DnaJ domain-containing protein [Parvimonas sp.]MCI5997841.1 DnaJ domain-containing protein [Parvimonas sp.]MDD7764550.1 DnaJ domain-containing protein [Peptoniphilaceae bacterium]MDY3050528.1 DnaJ domain-containing protein [Parvimonas sp.]
MKRFFGKFILGLSKFLDKFLGLLIKGLSYIVEVLSSISVLLILLGVAMLFLGSFLIPIILVGLILSPVFWIIVIVFFIVPFLGRKFISWLKYINYMVCEYLNDYGNYLLGNIGEYSNFKEYSNKYYRKQQEQRQREREERQRREREEWEQRFSSWNEFFTSGQSGFYQNYQNQGYYQNYGQNNFGGYSDPYTDFKNKFESCCKELEFESYDIDFYQVKLQYRKLAKKYHPDLNRDTDTTEKFQKINSAFEFLTEENIRRYKEISKR